MTKLPFALAAALVAGTVMTNAASADAVRVGFGLPLGSFVAHSSETYSPRDVRPVERPRYVRRDAQEAAPARKIVKPRKLPPTNVAEASIKAPETEPAKLNTRLPSSSSETTVIAKTPTAKSDTETQKPTTTASIEKPDTAKTEAPVEAKHICRRYSPAIAALVDVPCE